MLMFLHWPHVTMVAERSYRQLACLLIYQPTKVLSECFAEFIVKRHFEIFVIFHSFPQKPPRGWICTKFGTGVGVADTIPVTCFWWSVKGCQFWRGSKFALSHCQGQSLLMQDWRYRTACDMIFNQNLVNSVRSAALGLFWWQLM